MKIMQKETHKTNIMKPKLLREFMNRISLRVTLSEQF